MHKVDFFRRIKLTKIFLWFLLVFGLWGCDEIPPEVNKEVAIDENLQPSIRLSDGRDGMQIFAGQSVQLISNDPKAVILYSLDGSDLNQDSLVYTQPLKLQDDETTLKVKLFKDGKYSQLLERKMYKVKLVCADKQCIRDEILNNFTKTHFNYIRLDENLTDLSELFCAYNINTCNEKFAEFNADISAWEVDKVENMEHMFWTAKTFNQNINRWNVSKVKNMKGMFEDALKFNQPLNRWNVISVKDMNSMFYSAKEFNQNLEAWNVSQVTNMQYMFSKAANFNQNIGTWNVSKVTNMSHMFASAQAFNQNISDWNVSKVTNMQNMFFEAKTFNQNINTWQVGNVENMVGMFNEAQAFNQNIGDWNVSKVKHMVNMFNGALAFNQDISQWDVSNVINMDYMFKSASGFNQNLLAWDAKLKPSVSHKDIFKYCRILPENKPTLFNKD